MGLLLPLAAMVGVMESSRNVNCQATSELLRGIPTQKEDSFGATNPMPARVARAGAVPRNGHDLARELRKRACAAEKVQWLAGIPPEAFASIFRVEIDAELLQVILSAMFAACSSNGSNDQEHTAAAAASSSVLSSLAQHCPTALSFAANFADTAERAKTEELLKLLGTSESCGKDHTAVRDMLLPGDN